VSHVAIVARLTDKEGRAGEYVLTLIRLVRTYFWLLDEGEGIAHVGWQWLASGRPSRMFIHRRAWGERPQLP
jgi:hypothetical protein